ncbi:MAG TPA: hypothetical protein VFD25_03925, partial [Clostridia bacterium]|nr:hypothetical protein [Clostridia bacterium]
EIPDINLVSSYYLIGDIKNQDVFKQQLINLYGGGLVKDGKKDNSEIKSIISLWLIVIAISLLLTGYEILLNKKETHVKVIFGEKTRNIFLKNFLKEFVFFLVASVLLFAITSLFTNSLFLVEYSVFMIICMLTSNAMLHLGMFRHNYKEAFSKYGSSVALLSASYAMKITASILAILIVSANFVIIFEAISFRTQKDFFQAHSEYVYIDLMYADRTNKTGDDGGREAIRRIKKADKLLLEIYKYCFQKYDAAIYCNIGSSIGRDEQIALFNKSAKDYLFENIKGLDKKVFEEEKIHIFFPKEQYPLSLDDEFMDYMLSTISRFVGEDIEKISYDIATYNKNTKLIGLTKDNVTFSDYMDNPIVVFLNFDDSLLINENTVRHSWGVFDKYIMYKITREELVDFISGFGFDSETDVFRVTNVYENYLSTWRTIKRTMYINIVLSILVILLEAIIIATIIKLEYKVNAMELSIKKTLGYSMLSKNRKILSIPFISSVFSVFGILVFNNYFNYSQYKYLFFGVAVFFILEMCIIFYYTDKMEKASVPKILKGGSL